MPKEKRPPERRPRSESSHPGDREKGAAENLKIGGLLKTPAVGIHRPFSVIRT
jgi:hypothetical protein